MLHRWRLFEALGEQAAQEPALRSSSVLVDPQAMQQTLAQTTAELEQLRGQLHRLQGSSPGVSSRQQQLLQNQLNEALTKEQQLKTIMSDPKLAEFYNTLRSSLDSSVVALKAFASGLSNMEVSNSTGEKLAIKTLAGIRSLGGNIPGVKLVTDVVSEGAKVGFKIRKLRQAQHIVRLFSSEVLIEELARLWTLRRASEIQASGPLSLGRKWKHTLSGHQVDIVAQDWAYKDAKRIIELILSGSLRNTPSEKMVDAILNELIPLEERSDEKALKMLNPLLTINIKVLKVNSLLQNLR